MTIKEMLFGKAKPELHSSADIIRKDALGLVAETDHELFERHQAIQKTIAELADAAKQIEDELVLRADNKKLWKSKTASFGGGFKLSRTDTEAPDFPEGFDKQVFMESFPELCNLEFSEIRATNALADGQIDREFLAKIPFVCDTLLNSRKVVAAIKAGEITGIGLRTRSTYRVKFEAPKRLS